MLLQTEAATQQGGAHLCCRHRSCASATPSLSSSLRRRRCSRAAPARVTFNVAADRSSNSAGGSAPLLSPPLLRISNAVAVVVTSPSLMHARRACARNVKKEGGSSAQAAGCRSRRQFSPGFHAFFAVFQQPISVVDIKPSQHRRCCTRASLGAC
jgi:hypothetical protein